MPGPGGEAFANYGQAVESIYLKRWVRPSEIPDVHYVRTKVVVSRSGRVLSAGIEDRSGHTIVDKSVSRVLDEVKELPPFPETARDEQRTFFITFELKPTRFTG